MDVARGKRITLAITGATGSGFGAAAARRLAAHADVERVTLLCSPTGRRCLADECGLRPEDLLALSPKLRSLDERNLGADISSGSHPQDGMVILPCSAGTLGRIASGVSEGLVTRAADVCLKERRPLVLCLRETPLNRIHLENLLRVHDAGAVVMPVMPGFYHHPETLSDLFEAFATRVLDQLGLGEEDPPALAGNTVMKGLQRPPLACEPPFWARGAHLQTIAAQYLPTRVEALPWTRRTLDLGDGDQLALRCLPGTSGVSVLLFHGLGGSVEGHYMVRAAARFHAQGHALMLVNHRGAGEGKGLASKPYHSGATRDLAAALALGRELFPGQLQVAVGFSISANMLLLLLGRDAELGVPDRAIAVNPPVDLEACSRRLSRGFNRVYDLYFIRRLRREIMARPGATPLPPFGSMRALDQVYTAPLAGFQTRLAYYDQCSCGPHLKHIQVPTVILSALDDPFAPAGDILKQELAPAVHLHAETTGGHMGYVARNLPDRRWLDYALDHYVVVLAGLEPPPLP